MILIDVGQGFFLAHILQVASLELLEKFGAEEVVAGAAVILDSASVSCINLVMNGWLTYR